MATSGSGILIFPQSDESSSDSSISVTEEGTPSATEMPAARGATKVGKPWPADNLEAERQLLPEGLPADAGEVVAKAFHESLRVDLLLPSMRAGILALGCFAGLVVLDSLLPEIAADVIWGMVLGATLVTFLPLGEMLIDQAWRRPCGLPCWEPESIKPVVSLATVGTMLLLVLPITLGFLVGLAWFTILAVPCGSLGIVWLMSSRISPVLDGFPFVNPLARREVGAVLLSGLIVTLGSFSVALCVRLGAGYRVSALIMSLWTWLFVLRFAGLMARRYFVRVHASERAA